jgi:hypothetical protein
MCSCFAKLNTWGRAFLRLWITPHPLHSLWIRLWITLLPKRGRALFLAPFEPQLILRIKHLLFNLPSQ